MIFTHGSSLSIKNYELKIKNDILTNAMNRQLTNHNT